MMVSRGGQLWFGTEGGISVLEDGEISSLTVADGLVSDHIDQLVEDLDGNVWASSAYGLSVITPDTLITYSKGEALTDNSIGKIFVDSRGWIHVPTFPFYGLTVFKDPFTYIKYEEDEYIWDIDEAANGDILYATQGNGIRINAGEGSKYLGAEEGLTEGTIISLMIDHQGRIWCGSYYEGLFIYENGKFRHVTLGDGEIPVITSFFEDSKHRIWITFNAGVWLYNEDKYELIDERMGLAHNEVYKMIEDRYGNIWFATVGGASKYGRAIFEIYKIQKSGFGLPDNHVYSLFSDSRGRIWCGTHTYLGYISDDVYYPLGEEEGLGENRGLLLSFAEDKDGNIYIGTELGLLFYNGRRLESQFVKNLDEEKSSLQFNSLLYTNTDELWCGTDKGVYILKNGELGTIPGNDQIADMQVNDLEQIGELMYCATEAGISVFDQKGNHLMNYSTDNGLSSNICLDLVSDFDGALWIATDQGLSKMIIGEIIEIEKINFQSAPNTNITYFVEFSDNTSLWIGTERGLHRMDIISGITKYYGYDDGFYPLETNQKAVCRGKSNDLWIGTVDGLVHYLPKYDKLDLQAPHLIIHQPKINGESYIEVPDNPDEAPLIPFKNNTIKFSFTGIHTTIPEKNRFSYMLDGLDDKWTVPGKERTVTYERIPSGDYVLRVKAYNLDGVETTEDASYAFTIKTPYWKTPWFITLFVIAVLVLFYLYLKYRERQLIRDKRNLEKNVMERTREIEDAKIEIETQRDQIIEQNKGITDSIHYASRIQHAVLPGKLALEKYLPEHFILFKPRDIVSGDFYWVEQKNDRVIICAADCTGHGVPGAFMSMLGLTFLNEIVNKDEILKASEILNRLRSYIINALSHKDSQGMDGMDISLVVLDRGLNTMEYAGAYNPLILIRQGEVLEYKADKMPVGKHVVDLGPFTNKRIALEKGDVFYLFSDGFPDQFGGEKGGKYKMRPFRLLLERISRKPMEEQHRILEEELNDWMKDVEQVDDILVMGIRYE